MVFTNVTAEKKYRYFGSDNKEPRIIFTYKSLLMMKMIVDKVDKEVGWFGIVEKRGDNGYVITDIHVPKQETNGATCEITPEGLSELCSTLPAEQLDAVRMWGHSHGSGGVFASSQDDTQIMELLNNTQDYFIRVICNKGGNMSVSFFDHVNKRAIENINWFYDDGINHTELAQKIGEIVTANVHEFKPTVTTHLANDAGRNYHNHLYGDDMQYDESNWPILKDKDNKSTVVKKSDLRKEFDGRLKHGKAGRASFKLAGVN